MRNVKLAIATILLVSVSACASVAIDRAYDPSFDFVGSTTYDWAPKQPEAGPELPYAELDRVVRQAVDRALADKGFRRSAENPSFLVTYYVGVEEVTEITEDYYGYGWGGYWGYGWYGPTGVNVSQYDEGTVTIDILSTEPGGGLVWRGIGRGSINVTSAGRRMEGSVGRAVRDILDKFPPDID